MFMSQFSGSSAFRTDIEAPADSFSGVAAGHGGRRRLMTYYPMPCAATGVGMTCRSLLGAAAAAGHSPRLYTSRMSQPVPSEGYLRHILPAVLRHLPYPLLQRTLTGSMNRAYLDALRPGDIAYLWPSAPLEVFEAVHRMGIPIVAEAVNSLMARAKAILDAEYDRLGIKPAHGITDARVADQRARYEVCDSVFAPSPAVESGLARTPLADRFIPTSYGTWVPSKAPVRTGPRDAPVTVLFAGTGCVRKGFHNLLEAWRKPPEGARLRIVGQIEPALRARYAEILGHPSVSLAGFRRDVASEFAAADLMVLPSLEEGDPIVTYEAASHGLPVIATPDGAGRIGAETGAIVTLQCGGPEAIRAAIEDLLRDREARLDWGLKARSAAERYDWSLVAPRRFDRLYTALAG